MKIFDIQRLEEHADFLIVFNFTKVTINENLAFRKKEEIFDATRVLPASCAKMMHLLLTFGSFRLGRSRYEPLGNNPQS